MSTGMYWLKRWFSSSGMSAVQMGSTCLWPASLPPAPSTACIPYWFSLSNISPFLLFFKKTYEGQDTQEIQPVSRSEGLPPTNSTDAGKKASVVWHLGTAAPLDHYFPPWPRMPKKPKFTALVGLQVNSHPTARWGWRLWQWCCSLGFGPAHLMPNCNRASTLYFDPSCKTSGIGFDFQQYYCSCCWQHSAVALLNINATRTQAWRKCKISTNRSVCPPSNSFLCMCQN